MANTVGFALHVIKGLLDLDCSGTGIILVLISQFLLQELGENSISDKTVHAIVMIFTSVESI